MYVGSVDNCHINQAKGHPYSLLGSKSKFLFLLTMCRRLTQCYSKYGGLALNIKIKLGLDFLQIQMKILGGLYLIYYFERKYFL